MSPHFKGPSAAPLLPSVQIFFLRCPRDPLIWEGLPATMMHTAPGVLTFLITL